MKGVEGGRGTDLMFEEIYWMEMMKPFYECFQNEKTYDTEENHRIYMQNFFFEIYTEGEAHMGGE